MILQCGLDDSKLAPGLTLGAYINKDDGGYDNMSSLDRLSISQFSALTKLSVKALRLYDQKELLEPEIRDPINKYRYYSLHQLEKGIKIKMLVSIGFGIEEIKIVLDAVSDENYALLNEIMERRLTEIQAEIKRLEYIEHIIKARDTQELYNMKCSPPELKQVTAIRVISKREIGTYDQTIAKLINDIMNIIYNPRIRKGDVRIAGPIMFISHDDEFKEIDADIEVAVPIVGKIDLPPGFELKQLPETEVVSLIYTGPYQDIGIGYSSALSYVQNHEFEVTGPTREIYLNDPLKVTEDKLMTEIQIPIRRQNL